MSITVSNVAISFPGGVTLPSDAKMTVSCTIAGLSSGQTPTMYFPAAAMPTKMKSTSGGSWSASDQQMYAPGHLAITIEGINVTFDLARDGTATNINVGASVNGYSLPDCADDNTATSATAIGSIIVTTKGHAPAEIPVTVTAKITNVGQGTPMVVFPAHGDGTPMKKTSGNTWQATNAQMYDNTEHTVRIICNGVSANATFTP